MRRRTFIAALGGAAVWPITAHAQQGDRVRALQLRMFLKAEVVADMIGQFIRGIEAQVGRGTQRPWLADPKAGILGDRRFDAIYLLRQVPAIIELSQLDPTGHEQLRVSRLAMDVIGSQTDYSQDPKFTEAVAHKVYYGPVYFPRPVGPHNPGEPYMTLSVAGRRDDAGVTIAEIGLKLIQDTVARIKVGERGVVYVLDAQGRVIAHPDISLITADFSSLAQVQVARGAGSAAPPQSLQVVKDINGREVLADYYASVTPVGWLVFVELPVEEAQ
jgi:Cache domain